MRTKRGRQGTLRRRGCDANTGEEERNANKKGRRRTLRRGESKRNSEVGGGEFRLSKWFQRKRLKVKSEVGGDDVTLLKWFKRKKFAKKKSGWRWSLA